MQNHKISLLYSWRLANSCLFIPVHLPGRISVLHFFIFPPQHRHDSVFVNTCILNFFPFFFSAKFCCMFFLFLFCFGVCRQHCLVDKKIKIFIYIFSCILFLFVRIIFRRNFVEILKEQDFVSTDESYIHLMMLCVHWRLNQQLSSRWFWLAGFEGNNRQLSTWPTLLLLFLPNQ